MKNVPYIIGIILGFVLIVLGIICTSFQAICLGLIFIVLLATMWNMDRYIQDLEKSNENLVTIASEALKAAREANESDQKHIKMLEGLNQGMEMLLKDCNSDMVDRLNAVLEEHNFRVQEDDDGELHLFVKK